MSLAFGLSCKGGLNTNLNEFDMLQQPGMATELKNFEVDPDGGYRRINGYTPFGAVRPIEGAKVLGVTPYGLGAVVCVGPSVFYSEDGNSWIQVNYDTTSTGALEADLPTLTELDRPNQGQASFALMRAPTGHTDNLYGSLTIATGADKVAHFHIDGTGPTRTFVYEEISVPSAGKYVEIHDKHLCVVDSENAPSTVYYSATNDDRDFAGTGAGSVTIADRITGIKSFRDALYIFCENTIHRLDNINDPATTSVVQITNNIGCVSGYSIQEIGGDVLFLAPDGIRLVAATSRIGDVELSSVSRQVQSIISRLTKSISNYTINSVVIRDKSQYRLFYSRDGQDINTGFALIGTLTANGFEWSEAVGIQAPSATSAFDGTGTEKTYHGDNLGYIYTHDAGNYFYQNGIAKTISASYKTPNLDFGDPGTRKTIKYVKISLSPEGELQPTLRVRYDYEDQTILQPPDYVLSEVRTPAIFGAAVFGSSNFGGTLDPMIRQAIQGSGHASSFKIFSNDNKASYSINGLYFDYTPSGRR
jgi:hypothetical protein